MVKYATVSRASALFRTCLKRHVPAMHKQKRLFFLLAQSLFSAMAAMGPNAV